MGTRVRQWLIASTIVIPAAISCTLIAGRWADLSGIVPHLVARVFVSPALHICSVFEGPVVSDILMPSKLVTRACVWVLEIGFAALFAAVVAWLWRVFRIPSIVQWTRGARNLVCLGWSVVVVLVAMQVPPLREWLHRRGPLDLDAAERLRLWFLCTALAVVLPVGILIIAWQRCATTRGATEAAA